MKQIILSKIKENLNNINTNNYLVLKSNAYGFGLKEVIKLIKKTNLYKFCVINIEDAIMIRKKIINSKILLITPFNELDIDVYKKYNIELSIGTIEQLKLVKSNKLKYQIVYNSGMNRFGFKSRIPIDNNCTGVYSHNATDDIINIQNQVALFETYVIDYYDLDIHFFSSKHQNLSFGNCRRIGQDIYKDSLLITANVISYQFVKKGEYVGYDYTYRVSKDSIIGILDIGYADGIVRENNGYTLYSNGKFYPLIAKSCMNHSFVLLDNEYVKSLEIISCNNSIEKYCEYFNISIHEVYISYSLSKNNYI